MEALAEYGSSSDADSDLDEHRDRICTLSTSTGSTSCIYPQKQVKDTSAGSEVNAEPAPNVEVACTTLVDKGRNVPRTPVKGYVSKRKCSTRIGELESAQTDVRTASSVSDGHTLYFRSTDFSDGSKRRRLSNALPKSCEQLPNEHCKPVLSLNWHGGNSRVLLSCSLDGTIGLWDVQHKKCITTMSLHGGEAVSCGRWVTHNTVVTGGFDSLAHLSDVEKCRVISSFSHKDFVSVVQVHPADNNVIFTGDYSAKIQSWDLRTGKTTRQYVGAGGKILDMAFLQSGHELVASSDIVRKNASSQALRVWDVDSAVVVSNQVYSEPYTCPCLQTHPYRHEFYAQSNANYIVVFSGRKPYKCNKHKRYERHRVEGNKVQFEVSPDGTLLCSASANGQVVMYDCETSTALQTLHVSDSSCIAVTWNQHTPSTVAVSDWSSNISVLE